MTCPACREHLLEYVYGLLDAEAAAVRTHLDSCTACLAEYQKALKQQQLLGQASKVAATITFTAPKTEPALPLAPVFRTHRVSVVAWYATVAAVLLLVLGGNAGFYWWGRETKWKPVELAQNQLRSLEAERRSAEETQQELERLPKEMASLNAKLSGLNQDYQAKYEQALTEAKSKAAYFQLVAPTRVEAGRPLNYLVINKTLDEKPTPLNNYQINFIDREQGQQVGKLLASYNNVAFYKLNISQEPVRAMQANRALTNELVPDTQALALPGNIQHTLNVLETKYSTHLVTDKPLYQPGEEVFFRGLALDRATLQTPKEDLEFGFTLTSPVQTPLRRWKGESSLVDEATKKPIRGPDHQPVRGVGGGSYVLPENSPGGEYTLRMSEKTGRIPEQEVKFLVNAGPMPVLDKQLRFMLVSYAPGDEVRLEGTVKQNGRPWTGTAEAQVFIGEHQYDVHGRLSPHGFTATPDANGRLTVVFKLPEQVGEGEASVVLKFRLPQGVETWTQPFRIQTSQVVAECYPEGGDLIAGVVNRVYFQLRNSRGEPVEGQAELVDAAGRVIDRIETFHDNTEAKTSRGMGRFAFVPAANTTYQVRMSRPSPGQTAATLPAARPEGVVLQVDEPVLPAGNPLRLKITSVGRDRTLYVLVYCRNQLIALDQCEAKAGQTQAVSTNVPYPLGGVYRVTICELHLNGSTGHLQPLAERLVYGEPGQKLDVQLAAERRGDHQMELKVRALNELRMPTWAYMTVVGVHRSVLDLAADPTARKLPAHFLLAGEVRSPADLEHADFYLTAHPSARHALDLLLGVQGWRRFKETNLPQVALDQDASVVEDVVYRDNRRDVLAAVEAKVKEQVNREQKELLDRIEKVRQDIQGRVTFRQRETVALQTGGVRRLNEQEGMHAQLARVEQDWQAFQRWYSLTSAGLLGALGLVGVGVLLARRATVPAHLLGTLGVLSAVALAGAAFLAFGGDRAKQAAPFAEVRDAEQAVSRPNPLPKAGAPTPPREEDKATLAHPEKEMPRDEARQAPGNALQRSEGARPTGGAGPPGRDDGKGQRQPPPTALPTPGAVEKMSLKEERKQPGDKKALPSPSGDRAALPPSVVPAPAAPNTGVAESRVAPRGATGRQQVLNDQVAAQSQNIGRKRQAASPPGLSQVPSQVPQTAPSMAKDQEKAASSPAPATPETASGKAGGSSKEALPGGGTRGGLGTGQGGGGLGGGGVGDGGLGGGFGAAKTPSPLPESPTKAFVVREYSWRPGQRPDVLQPTWGQTVYWHPLQPVRHGELAIPLDLPPGEATYRFEVFGHDGQGRLGAATLDVKTPLPKPKPLSLRTKLSHTEAKQGDVVRLEIEVKNQTGHRQPSAEAVIPLPAGLTLPANVKQLRSSATGSAYDIPFEPTRWALTKNELTLTWNELAADQGVRVIVDLVCTQTGTSTADKPGQAYFVNQKAEASEATPLRMRVLP